MLVRLEPAQLINRRFENRIARILFRHFRVNGCRHCSFRINKHGKQSTKNQVQQWTRISRFRFGHLEGKCFFALLNFKISRFGSGKFADRRCGWPWSPGNCILYNTCVFSCYCLPVYPKNLYFKSKCFHLLKSWIVCHFVCFFFNSRFKENVHKRFFYIFLKKLIVVVILMVTFIK